MKIHGASFEISFFSFQVTEAQLQYVGRRHIGQSIGNLFSLWLLATLSISLKREKKSQRVYSYSFVCWKFFLLFTYTTNERQAGTKEEKGELSLFQLYMDALTYRRSLAVGGVLLAL